MLKQGTLNDKISALSTIIQRDPQHSLSYLQTLLGLAKKKNRKQAEQAVNTIKDLFCDVLLYYNSLLRDGNKLSAFSKNPLLAKKSAEPKELLQAYFEHQLKEIYSDFII